MIGFQKSYYPTAIPKRLRAFLRLTIGAARSTPGAESAVGSLEDCGDPQDLFWAELTGRVTLSATRPAVFLAVPVALDSAIVL